MIKGNLIVFSGIDGSGKSTICRMLYEHYKDIIPCAVVSAFQKRLFTEELRNLFDKYNILEEYRHSNHIGNLAWLGDLCNTTLTIIKPLLERGVTVFVDRYILCAKVYCVATTTKPIDYLFPIYDCLPKPDKCIYMCTEPSIAFDRIIKRNKKTSYYENEKSLALIKETYEKYIKNENYSIYKVNASQSLEMSYNEIVGVLDELILEK